jgi:hypothetical protein
LPGNEFSIASLAYGSGPSEYENLRVVVIAEVNNVAIVDEGQYSTTVSFTGDNPQICYSTVVGNDTSLCGTNIINNVNVRQLPDLTSQAIVGIVCENSTTNNTGPTNGPVKTDTPTAPKKESTLANSGQNWRMYYIAGLLLLSAAGGLGMLWHRSKQQPIFKS